MHACNTYIYMYTQAFELFRETMTLDSPTDQIARLQLVIEYL